jgi:hypothetical protein
LSAPRVLFTESIADLSLRYGLAVSRDPNRFLVVRQTVQRGGSAAAFVLLDHWRRSGPKAGAR